MPSVVAGSVAALTLVGVVVLMVGTALFDGRTLSFPISVQIAFLVGEAAVGAVPCFLLLRGAQCARKRDFRRAITASIIAGLVLLPGIGVAALYRTFADPCWDNPTCTAGPSFAYTTITGGIVILLISAVCALILSPILLNVARKAADQAPSCES
jgi:hypothetical protein